MADRRVCAPLLAESDAQNNPGTAPHEGSVTDADKVINTNTGSTEFEGRKSDEDLLKNLLADDYCHVCEAVLLFESQRLSHYEGKRHAHRVRVYLQAKRAEKTKKEDPAAQQTMTTDKDHFCELCNMMFSSHVVAKSHYEGKVHAKNIRKQGLQIADRHTVALPADDKSADKSSQDGCGGPETLGPAVSTSSPNAEADLKNPNKYCSLCAASFNNPHMAAQHYNGRKHQRNLSRQELLKGVVDHIKQANSLTCQVCGVQLNSLEMYKAHMQGNKHLSRKKKVIDICKSQQKAYGTFADELSDYIQIQKARGINPRLPTLPPKEQEEGNSDGEDLVSRPENVETPGLMTDVSLDYNSPYPSLIGCYNPAERCPPPHLDPSWPSRSLNYNSGPPLHFTRRKRRKPSASSSSYSSSDSSSTSDSEDSSHRDEKRSRGRTKRPRHEESEEKSRKWWSRGKPGDSEERRRKTRKSQSRQRGQERRRQGEDAEPVPEEPGMDSVKPECVTPNHKDPEQEGGEVDEASRHKNRKEKKKIKGEMDTRTEEERLWDDSILGF